MATVVLVQATPRNASTGATVAIRLAGGGSPGRAYTQLGFNDWRAGVAALPRFATALGFDQSGFTGGALPSTAAIRFFPSDKALLTTLSGLVWKNARIIVSIGDDETGGGYATSFVGTAADARIAGGALAITLGDLSLDLAKPVCPDTFLGTGGLEGGDDATGRIKRRSWGYVFNVEGKLLDKAYSIYEFGDPNRPLQAFPMVKDKGREAGGYVDVAWQGSAAATLTALRNASAPSGGCARAPSIACVKWWTTPAGPLTADIQGEVGPSYVQTAPEVAARIVSVYSTDIIVGNVVEALNWQQAAIGVHCDQSSETVGDLLDRLLIPVSLAWILGGDGVLTFRRFSWTGPVEALVADTIERETTFAPLKTRRVGFQRNHRLHTDAEISATLLLATDATYADGTPIEVLKPRQAGADVTGTNNAASITGQGPGATATSDQVLNNDTTLGALRIARPAGGAYTASGNVGGALKIKLPQPFIGTMIRFRVEVYDYATGAMATYLVGGYLYQVDGTWLAPSAQMIGNDALRKTVRFGYDGSTACIYIGEGNSTWSYPQVRVLDFSGSFAAYNESYWATGWAISFETGGAQNVKAVIVSPNAGEARFGINFLEDAGLPASLPAFKTILGQAASFTGQGAFATLNSAAYGSSYLTGFGALAPLGSLSLGSTYLRRADGSTILTDGTVVTSLGQSASIAGQGAFATLNSAGYGSSYLTGFGALAPLGSVYYGSPYLLESNGGAQAALNAFKTALGQAASIAGQGAFATVNSAAYGSSLLTGFGQVATLGEIYYGQPLFRESSGGPAVTLAGFKTSLGQAASISGQGPGATALGYQVLNNSADGVLRINRPVGGGYATQTANVAGALKVKLPQPFIGTMLRFRVEVYEYLSGATTTYTVSGYIYGDGNQWINTSAQMVGPDARRRTVRFGYDGSTACVWIGEPGDTWSYPQVRVLDFIAGFSGFDESYWATGWAIAFDTSAAQNVTSTIANPNAGEGVFGVNMLESARGVAAVLPAFKTTLGQAASISGQGAFATLSSAAYGSPYLTGFGGLAARSNVDLATDQVTNRFAQYLFYGNTPDVTVNSLRPGEVGANVTEYRQAASISGQGPGATAIGEKVLNNSLGNNTVRIGRPIGGTLGTSGNIGGPLKIKLPQSWTATMLRFEVEIYEYGTGSSATYTLGGYTHSGQAWLNTTAMMVGSDAIRRPVSFGHDGATCCIWIGTDASNWSYPQVSVKNFVGGFAGIVEGYWDSGWALSIGGAPQNVTSLVSIPNAGEARYGANILESPGVPASLAGFKTALGQAASIAGQTAWATYLRPTTTLSYHQDSGRITDTRGLNSSNAFGLRSLSQPPGFTASVSGSSATISLDGNGVYYTDWQATISLPSASFPGLAFSTMYYFWRNMPVDSAGDSYGYSTDLTQALGTGKSYFGNYTTPSSGGGGGGGGYYGGDNCVAADAFVPTANRGTIRASEVEEGDLLYVLSASLGRVVTAPCTGNRPGRNDCCRMLGEAGARLTLAINTPVTLRDGSWIVAANAWGREVGHLLSLGDEAPAWHKLPDVEGIGELAVARISCGDGTYAAGDDIEGPFLFSHNLRPQKP